MSTDTQSLSIAAKRDKVEHQLLDRLLASSDEPANNYEQADGWARAYRTFNEAVMGMPGMRIPARSVVFDRKFLDHSNAAQSAPQSAPQKLDSEASVNKP